MRVDLSVVGDIVAEATKTCELDQDSVDYAKEVILSALGDAESRDGLEEEIINSVADMLEGVDVARLAEKLVNVAFPTTLSDEPTFVPGDVVAISDLVLMYGGGRLLLKNSRLDLSRGRRYGIVGHNGAGKSTLLHLIAKKEIKELPTELTCVFVRHAVIAEDGESVLDYCCARRGHGLTVDAALDEVGFSDEMRAKDVSELSGGWRMRLALALALTEQSNYDVLLLDEPTNHLDVDAVKWVENYLQAGTSTHSAVVVVSHDPTFLNNICTDIIHFNQQKLTYHKGNFADFAHARNLKEDEVAALMSTDKQEWVGVQPEGADRFTFPIPGKLDGITNDKKAIMELKDVTFGYLLDRPVLKNVSARLSLGSRVAIVGANGAGKSTLMGLLCMELSPDEGFVDKHRNLRLAYIAQHHAYHLKEFENSCPMVYLQRRFRNGWDEELQTRLTTYNEEEQAYVDKMARKMGKYGRRAEMCVGRQKRGKELWYEVKWAGLDDAKQNTYEPLKKLKEMGIEGVARAFDERNQAAQSGADQRPLSTREICRHFEQFGFDEAMTTQRTISSFSAGQRSRLTLGAAFWVRPHCVCLDEPTNFLDVETVAALERALKLFRGAVMVVSHNQEFVAKVAVEKWFVRDQNLEKQLIDA